MQILMAMTIVYYQLFSQQLHLKCTAKLRCMFQNQRRGKFMSSVILINENVHPLTTALTKSKFQELIQNINIQSSSWLRQYGEGTLYCEGGLHETPFYSVSLHVSVWSAFQMKVQDYFFELNL